MKSTDSLLVFVPGPMDGKSPEVGGAEQPRLRLVRPALEIAQPIVPAGRVKRGRAKESYTDEILRMALDRMINHAANELLDDATRPIFEPIEGSEGVEWRRESAASGVIEPKNQVEGGGCADQVMSARHVIEAESSLVKPVDAE
ncbi:MAG: hypothetical protein KGS45_08570 [Planctomycetes bacterium]|nr:hypothetical protein [Planctomycetota bacterium]